MLLTLLKTGIPGKANSLGKGQPGATVRFEWGHFGNWWLLVKDLRRQINL
jgi:hypothetical protein